MGDIQPDLPVSGEPPKDAARHALPMRRLVAVLFALLFGVGAGLAAITLAPLLDQRWHAIDRTATLFIPGSVARDPHTSVRLVLTLPGLGNVGRTIGDQFMDAAEANHWILLAPSPSYDPIGSESLESADLRVDNELMTLIDAATKMSPAPVLSGLGVVGFSRGAQQGHRFAFRHGDRVVGLAAFSAGTYTMPNSQLPYPLGVGNFEFWDHGKPFDAAGLRNAKVFVGVGSLDENPADVARAWDDIGGTTRVARAAAFTRALTGLGIAVEFKLYPNTGHVFIPAMRDDAVALLRAAKP